MRSTPSQHAIMIVFVLALFVASCGGGSSLGAPPTSQATTDPPASSVSTTAAPSTEPSNAASTSVGPATSADTLPPSQSSGDAARDGVVAEVAALPFGVRVEVINSVVTPEGVWAITRLRDSATDRADGCRLGPEDGRYPTNFICTFEYGEVLLLNQNQTEILRAYPLPGVPPQMLEVGPDAVYCGRNGELPLPDAMMCRIDLATLQETVRVFPPGLDSVVVQPCFYPPESWSVDEEALEVVQIKIGPELLEVRAANGSWTTLSPTTLEIVERGGQP